MPSTPMRSRGTGPVACSASWNTRWPCATRAPYPEAVFHDMLFTDFVADQFGSVERIYDALDLPMTDEAAARMRAFIADNPQGKHGVHQYTPEEYGIDPATVRRDFAPYIERFGLAPG